MPERKVRVISCACGWSVMVHGSLSVEARRLTLTKHQREAHGVKPDEGNPS